MKTTLAIILAVALVGCAGLPNDYDFSEPTNYTSTTPSKGGIIAPRTILMPDGFYLIVPNYTTGEIQAVIKTP